MLGHSVQVAGIGTLKPTFNAHCATTPDELGSQSVYKVKVQFYPHKEFQKTLKEMDFEDMEAINDETGD